MGQDDFAIEQAKFKVKVENLTRTQKQVLDLFLQNFDDGAIATEIGDITESTVRQHIGNSANKLGIPSDKTDKGFRRREIVKLFRRFAPDRVAEKHYCDEILERPNGKPALQQMDTQIVAPVVITQEFTLLGRDGDRQKLEEFSRQHKIVLIKAGAGVGKSTLAREFLQTHFQKVIRLEMGLELGNVTPAEEKVAQILRRDFDEEPSRDFGINLDILREKLSDQTNPIGILIDNLEPALDESYRFRENLRGYDSLLTVLGDRDVCSFTLITSRRSLIVPRAKVHEYSLEGLDITAWRQYFHDCENVETLDALTQMRDAYNGNAKVMDILHGAIKNRFDGNIRAYWSRYKDALLADPELETLISVEMDWLRDNQPDAYKLLCRMGCYRYQDVKTVPFEGLICLLWDVPESRQIWVVDYLSKSSLIEIKCQYYLHPAIRDNAKSRLLENEENWEKTNRKAAEYWTKRIKYVKSIDDALTAFEAYYHYVNINDLNSAGQVISTFRNPRTENGAGECLGSNFYRFGLLEQICHAIEYVKDGVTDKYSLSRIYLVLGYVYNLAGRINEGIQCHLKSSKLARELVDLMSVDESKSLLGIKLERIYICSFINVGLCELDLWELDSALQSLGKFSILSKQYDYKDLLYDSYYLLAFVRSCIGFNNKDKETIFFLKKAKSMDLTFKDDWSEGYSSIFIGMTYKNWGELDKAFEVYCKAIIFAEKADYKQVKAKVLICFAELYRIKQDFNIALSHNLESIRILDKIKAKCDLAEAYFQLALTYQAMKEHDQAEEHKAKALELFAQMEAPKQIERVNKTFEEGAMK